MQQWQHYVAYAIGLLLAWPATGGEIRTSAAPPAGARVCVINFANTEQSCDGETPVRLQTMRFSSDNQPIRGKEALLSSALSAYVAQGFRIAGCHDLPGGKDGLPICILARDGR